MKCSCLLWKEGWISSANNFLYCDVIVLQLSAPQLRRSIRCVADSRLSKYPFLPSYSSFTTNHSSFFILKPPTRYNPELSVRSTRLPCPPPTPSHRASNCSVSTAFSPHLLHTMSTDVCQQSLEHILFPSLPTTLSCRPVLCANVSVPRSSSVINPHPKALRS